MKYTKETLEGIEFFDLMQAYRIADPTNQDRVCKKFEDVKDWINEKFIKQNKKMLEALKGLIKLKSVIQYTGNIPESQYDEAMAIDNLILQVESILNDLKP